MHSIHRAAVAGMLTFLVSAVATATTGKVTICHIPPGNPAAFHDIEVGATAVAAHLAHNDFAGRCEDDCNLFPTICSGGQSCDESTGICASSLCTSDGTLISYGDLSAEIQATISNVYPNAQVHCAYILVDGNYELDLTTTDQRNLIVDVDTRGNIISEHQI